jgi:hypothetical protein
MNNNNGIIIAVAIVVAAVIVKLPIGPQSGRFQGTDSVTLVDTTTGARWGWMGVAGWRQFSTGSRHE